MALKVVVGAQVFAMGHVITRVGGRGREEREEESVNEKKGEEKKV